MKKPLKIISIIILILFFVLPVSARQNRSSEEYLKNKRHITPITPVVENFAQTVVKKVLKKETGKNFKVKFSAYTLSSMKRGIFKSMEIQGKDVEIKGLNLSYINLKTLSDYNWIDYRQNPPVFKSDINCAYEIGLDDNSINNALKLPQYQKKLQKVNQKAYPLFSIHDVRVKINDNRMRISMEYNFPLSPKEKNKTFSVSSKFRVHNGKIYANDVSIERKYGNLPIEKVTNLINLLDPLSYILSFMNPSNCNFTVENVNIIDDIIQISGKILIKGEQK